MLKMEALFFTLDLKNKAFKFKSCIKLKKRNSLTQKDTYKMRDNPKQNVQGEIKQWLKLVTELHEQNNSYSYMILGTKIYDKQKVENNVKKRTEQKKVMEKHQIK